MSYLEPKKGNQNMKQTITATALFLMFIGFTVSSANAAGVYSPAAKITTKEVPSSAVMVCSDVVKVWRNPATGQWESEIVDDPTLMSVKPVDSSQKTAQQPVAKSKIPDKIG